MTAQELWDAIKWSNQSKDGSIYIPADRIKGIEEAIKREASK